MTIKNNNGVILIVVLWVLIILSVLAIGLGRQTSVALQMTKHQLAQVRARDAVWENLKQAVEQAVVTGQLKDEQEAGEDFTFNDESGKLNINALDQGSYDVLRHLIMILGQSEETAQGVASSIVDWRDENDSIFNAPFGAEEKYYAQLDPAYHCKNAPFESLEELLLVRGVTKEIFDEMKPYITIFPVRGSLKINMSSVSRPVLQALARSFSGARTNTNIRDADSLTDKILNGRPVEVNGLILNAAEKVIIAQMARHLIRESGYVRFRVKGKDELSSVSSEAEAVVSRETGKIVYWRRL